MQLRSEQFSQAAYRPGHRLLPSSLEQPRSTQRRYARRLHCKDVPTSCAIQGSTTIRLEATASSTLDIDSPYKLKPSDTDFYRTKGFVKLKNVFDDETLSYYAPEMSLAVKQADKTPLQSDPDYQQAFTQVSPNNRATFHTQRSCHSNLTATELVDRCSTSGGRTTKLLSLSWVRSWHALLLS